MEWASLEVQRFPRWFADALFSSAQRPEVFSSLGSDVREKLQDYSASYGQTKKNMQIDERKRIQWENDNWYLAIEWYNYGELVRLSRKT